MHFAIKTPIPKNFKETFKKFNRDLFVALAPPLGSLEVVRFDGCKVGDIIEVKIMGRTWISHISEFKETDAEIYFIDEGRSLPSPLKYWKHTHRIKRVDANNCFIIDDIEFSSGNELLDKILYPALYATFSLRGPIYKRELS